MISDRRKPKTKYDLIKSIQSVQRMEFDVIEVGSIRDRPKVTTTVDRRVSRGPVSVIIIQEK